MEISISELRQEFTDYLDSLTEQEEVVEDEPGKGTELPEKNYDLDNPKVSIFSHADELDDFLNKNYKDEIEKSTIKTDEILKLEFRDGKFIEEEKTDEDKNDKLPIVEIINDVLSDERIKEHIDLDGNKELSEEEAKKFINSIEKLDGNEGDISIKDIIQGLKAIKKNDLTPKPDETQVKPVNYNTRYSKGYAEEPENIKPYRENLPPIKTPTDKLKELELQRTGKESDLSKSNEAFYQIFKGENNNVKTAKNKYDKSKENYLNLLKNENNISTEQKKKLEDALNKVESAIAAVDEAQIKLQEAENAVILQEITVAECESNLNALQSSLSELKSGKSENSENKTKISELNKKISDEQKRLKTEKSKLKDLEKIRDNAKKDLEQKQEKLIEAKYSKEKIENEFIINNSGVSQELKDEVKSLNKEDKNVENIKKSEAVSAKQSITDAQSSLREISDKLSEEKEKQIKSENSVLSFNLNFQENLTASQKADLESFKANYEQNKSRYKEVERQTGLPAELIAAIHWRESSGDFGTYLHNGDPLGRPTVNYPSGIYFGANQWTEAAIDAIRQQGLEGVNPKDTNSLLEFAERYNGLGYRNKGVPSPYVWAGTTNYKCGKYVADSVYDPNYVDTQLGVAVMMKAIS